MEENKNLENEIIEEVIEEATEEATEEAIEETTEETIEVTKPVEEAVAASAEAYESYLETKKRSKTVIIIVAVAIALAVAVAAVVVSMMNFNKYNRLGYVDISGRTVQDLADAHGITLAEFLEAYGLPSDMPGDTTEANAYYSIPTGVIAEMNKLDFETLKAIVKLPDDVTAETPWGIAEGKILLADRIGGADKVEAFKQQYGLGDDVTAETPWSEVRNAVDEFELKKRKAEEAAKAADSTNQAPEGEAEVVTE